MPALFGLLLACLLASSIAAADDKTITLLFTNDMESAYEPFPAWWIDDMDRIGGLAHLATLIDNIRRDEPNVFLFDAGDIFTGALSLETNGRLMFEFMMTMGYDAMAIGNHEYEYGEAILAWQKNRVAFPVLGANIFYRGTDFPYAQPHAIIERDGVRIGVIGILGQDAAATTIAAEYNDEIDVRDPAETVQRSVDELRDDVDLIVLLTHMGHTAPMQTDAEIDPRLERDIDADLALADAVTGVDILFGGHADAGTWEPVVSPKTGTLVMQTFGQAMYLGYLQLRLDSATGEIASYDGRLIPVDTDALAPHPVIERKYRAYREAYPHLSEVVGQTEQRLNRQYFDESDIGNLMADVGVDITGADIGLVIPGSIRKDLPKGDVEVVDILDTNPFVDPVVVVQMSGEQLRRVMEQSFTHLRGLLQVSGLEVVYDMSRPEYNRLVSLKHDGTEIADDATFEVAIAQFLATGGDHYTMFTEAPILRTYAPQGSITIDYFRKYGTVPVPAAGRQTDLSAAQE